VDTALIAALAHHESGHAVVNRLLGVGVESVEVTDEATKTTTLGLDDLEANRPESDEYRRRAEPFLIGQLAGGIAERRFTGKDSDSGSDDRQNAGWLAIEICPTGLSLQDYIDEMARRAEDIVDQNWTAIRRVADRLVQVGHVGGDVLDALIWPAP
jgi:hypothetical protein